MFFSYRTRRGSLEFFGYLFLLILVITILPENLDAQELKSKKVVIMVLDNISLNELTESNTPNFDALIKRGGLAQMNIRSKSSLSNRGSSYLSLALGVRTLASTKGGLAYDKNDLVYFDDRNDFNPIKAEDIYRLYTGEQVLKNQIVNLSIMDTIRASSTVSTSDFGGLFGERAKELGLIIGIVGNSDSYTPKRESTILAMDQKGQIPYGAVGSELLRIDKEVLGGIRLDERKLLKEVERILPKVDILFVDYGDTVRIQDNYSLALDSVKVNQKLQALHRADVFLGRIISKVDLSCTLLMVISPNPSREAILAGNFGLTPIILANPDAKKGPGVLTSNTTRRQGLVTNFDFAPTVFQFFEKKAGKEYLGEPIQIIKLSNPIEKIMSDQNIFLSLRQNRAVFHWAYIATAIIVLLLFISPISSFREKLNVEKKLLLLLFVLALPITLITVSFFGYALVFFDLFYVLFGALLIAIIIRRTSQSPLLGIGIIAIFTCFLLLIDVLAGGNLMIISPLGSDAIAGGRFYGIGNDYMGILLGSSILGLFSLYEYFPFSRAWMMVLAFLLLILVAVGLSPIFGANVGGTLAALVIGVLAIFLISDRHVSMQRVLIIIFLVTLIIVCMALLDAYFNPNPTHAGKVIKSLFVGGWQRFFEIVSYKLSQASWNLRNANWNIVLFLEISIIWLMGFKKGYLNELSVKTPKLYKGLKTILLGSIVVFIFNDTGTVASALMLMYLVFPMLIYESLITDKVTDIY